MAVSKTSRYSELRYAAHLFRHVRGTVVRLLAAVEPAGAIPCVDGAVKLLAKVEKEPQWGCCPEDACAEG